MGSAGEAVRRRGGEADASQETGGDVNATPKWRVTTRVLPLRENDLVVTPIDPEKLHPLTSAEKEPTATAEEAPPVEVALPATQGRVSFSPDSLTTPSKTVVGKIVGATEVVALEEGELDPLGAFAMGLSPDPNSIALPQKSASKNDSKLAMTASFSIQEGTIKHLWTAHKDRVLAKLSDETFTIKASMLETNDIEGELSHSSASEYQRREDDGPVMSADDAGVVRKSRARLEQLERRQSSTTSSGSSSGRTKTVEITQQEYVRRIKQMQADLVKAWQQNQKVQALRIAIKCVKQLSDTSSAPQLYPLAFVLVSDVLDEFGGLVFERIKARASEDENGQPLSTPLGEKFTSDEVNIHAKETCRNWFYKTACIRELLPRIYIEIALLKSYRFLGDGEFPQIVARLSNMIKGVGEPMVALYTRLYLALASTELVSPNEKTAVLSSLFDYFFAFQQYQDQGKLVKFLEDQKLQNNEYFALHSPAVEWLMKCTAHGANPDVFDTLLEQYKEYSDNSMVLKHLCESFGASSYAANPLEIFHLMRTASPSQYSKCHLYSVLAIQLSHTPFVCGGIKEAKLRFLNEVWSSITAQEDIEAYMECAAAYMKLIVAHYAHREATILLKDVMRHLNSATPEELTPKVYNLLGAFIENVVHGAQQHTDFFTRLIPSGEFLSLMGMFRREASVGVAKKVLQAFVTANSSGNSKRNNFGNLRLHVVGPEAAVAHTLFVICCRVHDSLDSLSTTPERNEATKDIVAFISRLGYAKNAPSKSMSLTAPVTDAQLQEEEEALLMLYIDCRSAFYKLEPIKVYLTKYVIALAMRVHGRMQACKEKSSINSIDRRRDFIKSCLAYTHITIPSISLPFMRLELLVLCAKAALHTNCLPQMEAFIKSAIVVIADLDYTQAVACGDLPPVDTEELNEGEAGSVVRTITELVAVVAYAPSSTDDAPFYFVEALRKGLLERMAWIPLSSSLPNNAIRSAIASKCRILVKLSELYAMWGQTRFVFHIDGIDSNDVLYGGDDFFQQEAQRMFSSMVDQVVREIEAISDVVTGLTSQWESAATQTELLIELASAIYPYLAFDDHTTIEGSSERPAAESGRHRSVRSRSGAVLLRKCFAFAHGKLQLVANMSEQQTEKRKEMAESLNLRFAKLVDELTEYVQFLQKKKASLFSISGRQALDALETSLETFTSPA